MVGMMNVCDMDNVEVRDGKLYNCIIQALTLYCNKSEFYIYKRIEE